MVRKLRGRGASSVILYLLRPFRYLFSRFAAVLFVTLALIAIFISKTQPQLAEDIRMEIVDAGASITNIVLVPLDLVKDLGSAIEKYLFVYDKNEQLRAENRELENRLSLLAQAELENRRLKQLLSFVQEPEYHYISARVVGDTTSAFIRSILINAGKWSGIKTGQAVISEKGVIGRVIEVGKRSSRVLLLTDINSRIPVISTNTGIRSILAGNNREHPELTYLPENSNIRTGETLVTSGDGELFPPSLKIGTIYQSPEDNKYYVEPYSASNSLQFVSVLEYRYPYEENDANQEEDSVPLSTP